MDRRILKPLIISLFTLPSTAFAQDYSVLSCDGLKPVIIEASAEMDGLSVYMLDEKLVGTAQSDGSWFVMNEGTAAQFDGQNLRTLRDNKAKIYPCSEVDEAVASAAIELAKQLAHRAIASERDVFEKYSQASKELVITKADLQTALGDATSVRSELKTLRASTSASIETLQSELSQTVRDLFETEDRLEEALALALARRNALGVSAEELRQQLAVALAARKAAEADLQTALDDATSVRGELETLRTSASVSIETLQSELSKAVRDLFETEARLEAAQRTLDLAKAELVTLKDERVDAASLEEELALALARRDALDVSAEELRKQLAAALAARKAAEARTAEQLTETEARDALLAQAKAALADQEEISLKAQREAELLNQQITALNQQLGELQALLDTRIAEDSRNKIQMATLGQDLNTALAQVAAQKAELARLAEARAAALEARNATLEGYQSEFFGRMREALADVEGLRIEGDRFVFDSAVLFESGSATVSFAGANEIKAVVDTLKLISQEIPNEIEWVIQVDGHTDNVPVTAGPFENNWELSQARALSVVRLLNKMGIPPERLSANGFGEHQPIDTADTPDARAMNRRIELKLTER